MSDHHYTSRALHVLMLLYVGVCLNLSICLVSFLSPRSTLSKYCLLFKKKKKMKLLLQLDRYQCTHEGIILRQNHAAIYWS
jgi:hypothetical protein